MVLGKVVGRVSSVQKLPTLKGLQESFWNPSDPRILTPHFFGWGYSINIPALLRRFQ